VALIETLRDCISRLAIWPLSAGSVEKRPVIFSHDNERGSAHDAAGIESFKIPTICYRKRERKVLNMNQVWRNCDFFCRHSKSEQSIIVEEIYFSTARKKIE